MHLFTEESLAAYFHALDGKKAVGVDGVSKAEYGEQLGSNLKELIARMKRMGYRPGPVGQVLIPKGDKAGAMRPLGISNFEDKLVQGVMRQVLESIYEPLFLPGSYGFRPGRGCHDAVRDLHHHPYRHPVQTVIDVDLAKFFDTIDHELLLGMLREKINDPKFLRYVQRMFKSGVLAEGELTVGDEGVPQGSLCSPILANIFAHYVIDVWLEGVVKSHCAGEVAWFRYADDLLRVRAGRPARSQSARQPAGPV
jgi:group II intron reverse transcriptase/maturase